MFKTLGKVFLLVAFSSGLVIAQSNSKPLDSAEVKKVYRPWSTFLSLRSEIYFSKGSSLFGEVSYTTPNEYASLNEAYKSYFWFGYEQAFSKKWFGGVSGRMNFVEEGAGSFFTRLNFAHRGSIGKLFFYKELAFEHLYYAESDHYKRKAEGRISPCVGLGKSFKVANKSMFIGVNYRAFLNFDFQDDKSSIYKNRVFDRTKLRFDVTCQLLQHWAVGLYYLKDTEYYYTLAQYDINNNVVVPDYKLNQITQGLGVTLTYLLFKENPDQYIPGFPSR